MLTLIKDLGTLKRGKTTYRWGLYLCGCGVEKEIRTHSVKNGRTTSCGCAQLKAATKHGVRYHRLYTTWGGIIARCNNENCKDYPNYGGRGVKVCDRWLHSPELFIEDMSPKPNGCTLDRKDNSKGYSPENCKWSTLKEQGRNRRTNRLLSFYGETLTLIEWSEVLEVPIARLRSRLHRGWTDFNTLSMGNLAAKGIL